MLKLSAKRTDTVLMQAGKSLMYIKNSKGPEIDPRGAPHSTGKEQDVLSLI